MAASCCEPGNTIRGQALKQWFKVHILREGPIPPIAYLYVLISDLGGSDKFYGDKLGLTLLANRGRTTFLSYSSNLVKASLGMLCADLRRKSEV